MQAIIKVESKRIMKSVMNLVFFVVVLLLSINSSYQAVKRYELWDQSGYVTSGAENLKHAKENESDMEIEQAIAMLREKEEAVFVDETNIEMLVNMNYSDKAVGELSNEEINLFLENRLRTIARRLNESIRFTYTEEEKERLLERVGKLSSLTIGYSEGWKILNRDMGSFLPLIMLMISLLIMPLFADDTLNKMKELSRSTRNGKRQLATARFISAFMISSMFYLLAIFCFFFIKMLPFGFAGGSEAIQSNAQTFFSVFPITYLEQLLLNCVRGYMALIFVVALTVLISATYREDHGGECDCMLFWLLLLVMEQMMQFEVNHWFANFMPLRLSGSTDFYTANEIYRFGGYSFDSIVWCPLIALMISVVMMVFTVLWLMREKLLSQVGRR